MPSIRTGLLYDNPHDAKSYSVRSSSNPKHKCSMSGHVIEVKVSGYYQSWLYRLHSSCRVRDGYFSKPYILHWDAQL